QPGAAPALAPVPALRRGPRRAPARVARPGAGRARRRGAAPPGGRPGGPARRRRRPDPVPDHPGRTRRMTPLRIGTRGSPLALWQAHFVADRLRPLAAGRPVELVEIVTSGDVVRD